MVMVDVPSSRERVSHCGDFESSVGVRSHAAVLRVAGKEIIDSMTIALFGCFALVRFPSDRIAIESHPAINTSSE